MLSTGVDILHIPRMKLAIERYGQRLLDRCFTAAEIKSCRGFAEEFAARYAAKEAVSKTLGVGLRIMSPFGIKFHEVEILPDRYGKPHVHLHGRAAQLAQDQGLTEWSVSMTHEKEYAVAFVVATSH
jgi:holo-[acyl-carrier protein] synthase